MKRFLRNPSELKNHVDNLKLNCKNFIVVKNGAISKIEYANKVYYFGNRISSENKEIVQACRSVKYDCQLALQEGRIIKDENIPQRFSTKIFDKKVFENYSEFYAFDIESCYWNIAYHSVPFLTLQTYRSFYEKKDIRNIALGNLGKLEIHEIYENGIMVERLSIKNDCFYVYCAVRYKARCWYDCILDICNGDVGYYNTDEYVIPNVYAYKVMRFLKSEKAFSKKNDMVYEVIGDSDKTITLKSAISEEIKLLNKKKTL